MADSPSPATQPFDSNAREAVTAYCRSHLVDTVFTQIEPLRMFDDDPEHLPQCLRLLAVWEGVTKRTFKGTGEGGRDYTAADLKELESIADKRTDADLTIRVATSLSLPLIGTGRPTHDVSASPTIYLDLPCRDVDPSASASQSPAFRQVLISIAHPDERAFQLNLLSYGLLGLLHPQMRHIHPSLQLLYNKLVLYYPLRPHTDDDKAVVSLTLTSDPSELFHWLGLKVERWEAGFHSLQDLVGWLADVRDGSVIGQQWIRTARVAEERRQTRILEGKASDIRVKRGKKAGITTLTKHLWTDGWADRKKLPAEDWAKLSKVELCAEADKIVARFHKEDLLRQSIEKRLQQEKAVEEQEQRIPRQAASPRVCRADAASDWRRKA